MFYQFSDDVTTVEIDQIDNHYVTVGYVTVSEFERIYSQFGFAAATAEMLKSDNF